MENLSSYTSHVRLGMKSLPHHLTDHSLQTSETFRTVSWSKDCGVNIRHRLEWIIFVCLVGDPGSEVRKVCLKENMLPDGSVHVRRSVPESAIKALLTTSCGGVRQVTIDCITLLSL